MRFIGSMRRWTSNFDSANWLALFGSILFIIGIAGMIWSQLSG